MLERIIKIMVSDQGNGCPPILDRGRVLEMSKGVETFESRTAASSAWEQQWPPMEATVQSPALWAGIGLLLETRRGRKSAKKNTQALLWPLALASGLTTHFAISLSLASSSSMGEAFRDDMMVLVGQDEPGQRAGARGSRGHRRGRMWQRSAFPESR